MIIVLFSAYLISLISGNQYYCRRVQSDTLMYGDVCVPFDHQTEYGFAFSGTYNAGTCEANPKLHLSRPNDKQFSDHGIVTPSNQGQMEKACGSFHDLVVTLESAPHIQGNCEHVVRGPYGTLYRCGGEKRNMDYSVNYWDDECSYVLQDNFRHDRILARQCLQSTIVDYADENQVSGKVSMSLETVPIVNKKGEAALEDMAKLVCQGISYIAPVSKLSWLVFERDRITKTGGLADVFSEWFGFFFGYSTLRGDAVGAYRYKIATAKMACVKLQELRKDIM